MIYVERLGDGAVNEFGFETEQTKFALLQNACLSFTALFTQPFYTAEFPASTEVTCIRRKAGGRSCKRVRLYS